MRRANVCGIVSIVVSGISFIICWWLSIVGLVLSIIGVCIPDTEKTTSGIGALLSIVALVVNVVVLKTVGIF